MKIVVMGAPGSGKGTQSPYLQERYGVCHLSTGDMLRDAVAKKTEYGVKAKAAIDSGALVTDDIVFGIVKEAMKRPECAKGYIIDGLPRTELQAKKMHDSGIGVDKVILFNVPDDVIIQRTSGRWIHRASGRTYHEVFRPPKKAGVDDITGEELMQRADDKKEVATKRLALFHKELNPIVAYYQRMGVFEAIDANRPVDAIRSTLADILDPLARKLGMLFSAGPTA